MPDPIRPEPDSPLGSTLMPASVATDRDDGRCPSLVPEQLIGAASASPDGLHATEIRGPVRSAAGAALGAPADGGVPEGDPGALPTTLVASPPGAAPPRSVADPVPGYELLSELGRGAMGVVHRARDVRLNRIVALKRILIGSHAGDRDRIMFLEEARAVARLQHPNIVQVFEVGEAGGTPFCALEYVAGGTLAGALKGEPQEPAVAAARALVLARAMSAVHAAGLIHRDLKPANVLLGPEGTLKITDFGLAKRLDAPSGRTQPGQVLGTPSYMAPEQAVGDAARVGPVSDVWGLGAILYEMVTGRPPFRGTGIWDTIAQVLTVDPVPVRRLQPGCPRDLETVCLKCLEKDERKRYPSAAALADDLARYLDGRPVLARRAGPVERAVKWTRRSPLRAALVAAVAACAGMLAAVLVLQARSARQEADQLRLEGELTQRELNRELDVARRREGARDRFAGLLAGAERDAATATDVAAWDRVAQRLRSALELADGDPEAFAGWPLRSSAADLLARSDAAIAAARQRDKVRASAAALGERHADAVFHATLATGLGYEESLARVRRAVAEGLALFGVTPDGNGPPAVEPGILTPNEARLVLYRCYELLLLDAEVLARPVPGELGGALRARVADALARLERADRLLSGVRTRSGLTRRAECLKFLRRDADAQEAATAAVATPPVLAADHFLIGLGYHRADDFGRAVPALNDALQAEPGHFGAQYLLAVCQLRQRHPQDAKVAATRCLEQRPKFSWPRVLRASAEMELARQGKGDYAIALADLNAVLDDPSDEDARYAALTERGVLALRRLDWGAAVADQTDAIRRKPEAVAAYINLALTHKRRAEFFAVRGDLLALGAGPAGAVGSVAVRTGPRTAALDAAVAALDRAILRQPRESRLYHERGQIHLLRGDPVLGRRDLTEALVRAPNAGPLSTYADDLLLLGQVLNEGGQYPAAAKAYAAVLDIPASSLGGERRALAARRLAGPLFALGRWDEAIKAIDVYLDLTPATDGRGGAVAEALKARGLILAKQKNLRGAGDSYTRSLGLVRDPEVLALRGWVYLVTGAAALAEQDFDEVLKSRPGDADALIGRADARVKLGRVRDAVADAEDGARRIPGVAAADDRVRLRFNAARVFAQATVRDPDPLTMAARTAGQLRAALADVPAEERAGFWKDKVMADPVLAPVSGSPAVRTVAAEAGLDDR